MRQATVAFPNRPIVRQPDAFYNDKSQLVQAAILGQKSSKSKLKGRIKDKPTAGLKLLRVIAGGTKI